MLRGKMKLGFSSTISTVSGVLSLRSCGLRKCRTAYRSNHSTESSATPRNQAGSSPLQSQDLSDSSTRGALYNPPKKNSEAGATLVEASIAVPVFLFVLFASFTLLHGVYQIMTFQYIVADTLRETFTRSAAQRGSSWEGYFTTTLRLRAQSVLPSFNTGNIKSVTFTGCTGATGWGCAATATTGSLVAVTVETPKSFGVPQLTNTTFVAKAVAVVQMGQNE
jgi:hypothetical protein